MSILTISTTVLDEMINTYSVHKEDVIAESGTSETGVDWDQRVRDGKATVTVGFTMTDAEIAAFGVLIADAYFTMTYLCRGSQMTSTFKVRSSDENMLSDDLWETEITFKEL